MQWGSGHVSRHTLPGGAYVEQAPGGGAPSSTSVNCRLVRLRCRGSLMSFTRYVFASSTHFARWVCCAGTAPSRLDQPEPTGANRFRDKARLRFEYRVYDR